MSIASLDDLTKRSQGIFNRIVNSYLEAGTPVGSSVIAEQADVNLSSASIRSIMSELEMAGLLFSPHRSAGRIPTRRAQAVRRWADGSP